MKRAVSLEEYSHSDGHDDDFLYDSGSCGCRLRRHHISHRCSTSDGWSSRREPVTLVAGRYGSYPMGSLGWLHFKEGM